MIWLKRTVLILTLAACTGNESNYNKSWTADDKSLLIHQLTSSLDSVLWEIDSLTDEQWNLTPSPEEWSVALVIEHLITHDELFGREVRVLSQLPIMNPQPDSLFATDAEIVTYRKITPDNTGKAPSYLVPAGRWCSKADAIAAYRRARSALIDFVSNANVDLRKYYTTSGRGPTKYRDLHQLLLISVAHTERHLQQIRRIRQQNVDRNP